MRRSRMPTIARQATAALLLIAGAISLKAAAPKFQLPRLRKQVVDFAGGPQALTSVQSLSFDFVVYTDGKPGPKESHQYDRTSGLYRYEVTLSDLARLPVWDGPNGDQWQPAPRIADGETLVAIFRYPALEGSIYIDGRPASPSQQAELLPRVADRVRNARAWMFFPFFMGSPHLNTSLVPDIDDSRYGHLSGFEAWWGEERGDNDVWTLYLDHSGRLVRTDVWLRGSLNTPPLTAYWDDWQQLGPVRIAREHVIPATNRHLTFENLRINRPVDMTSPRPLP